MSLSTATKSVRSGDGKLSIGFFNESDVIIYLLIAGERPMCVGRCLASSAERGRNDMSNPRYPRDVLPQELGENLLVLQERLQQWGTGKVVVLAAVLIAILWLASGLYVVGPGERGVVLLFREATEQTDPGLHYRFPWPIQSHAIVDVSQVRRAEIGFRTTSDSSFDNSSRGGNRTVPQEALMLTGDENIVEVQLFVQYRVQDPVKFLFGAYDPENVLHTSAQVALRSVVGQNTIDYTMTEGRLQSQEQITSDLQKLLDAYQTGLLVTEARLLVVDPPAEVRDAFHDVVRALEDWLKKPMGIEKMSYRKLVVRPHRWFSKLKDTKPNG
jgi:HflK protein